MATPVHIIAGYEQIIGEWKHVGGDLMFRPVDQDVAQELEAGADGFSSVYLPHVCKGWEEGFVSLTNPSGDPKGTCSASRHRSPHAFSTNGSCENWLAVGQMRQVCVVCGVPKAGS